MKTIYPESVKSSINWFKENSVKEDLNRLKKMPESKLISLHHSLGRWIRNNFGLWNGNKSLLKDCLKIQRSKYKEYYLGCEKFYKIKTKEIHPDDASLVIIYELWRDLNELV